MLYFFLHSFMNSSHYAFSSFRDGKNESRSVKPEFTFLLVGVVLILLYLMKSAA